jgi:hypothetical protein
MVNLHVYHHVASFVRRLLAEHVSQPLDGFHSKYFLSYLKAIFAIWPIISEIGGVQKSHNFDLRLNLE